MKLITILVASASFINAQQFEKCLPPSPTRPCSQIDSIATSSNSFDTILSQTQCDSNLSQDDIKSKLVFYIYEKNKAVQVINGTDFIPNPGKFMNTSAPCIRFFMGGFLTDCDVDVNVAASSSNWRVYCAGYLKEMSTVVVVNWSKIGCGNYVCLSLFNIEPIGRLLGNMFNNHFDLSKLYLAGHSLGGHILAYACDTVLLAGGGKSILELTVLDLAGFLFQNNNCLLIPEVFKNIMRPNIAKRTIAIYTNPCVAGIGNYAMAQINIIVNYPFFILPGNNLNIFYNHSFAGLLYAAFCTQVKCFVNNFLLRNDVNTIFNVNLKSGTYYLNVKSCFPYCC